MTAALDADVIVVGAGMVGLTAALAMHQAGFNVLLLEQRALQPEQAVADVEAASQQGFDPRVSALTCASQQIFSALGAWPTMQALRVSPYTDMDVWDGQGTGQVQFSAAALHEPCLGHIVENRVTVAGLCQALELTGIRLLTEITISTMRQHAAGRTLVLDDGRELTAQLVVAADGAHSHIRQLAGLPMCEWDYGHHAIVTTVETERSHQTTAWQRFTEDGPLAFLPLNDGGVNQHSSIVWSTSPQHANALMALDDSAFCQVLGKAFEHRLGQVEATAERYAVPLRQRHAQYYIKPAFAVIGDAAHTIHPLAGQGVNLGLLDAAQLTEVVQQAKQRGEDIGSVTVLRRFQRVRQSENLKMTAAMEGFKQLFGQQNGWLGLLRNTGMHVFQRAPSVKNHLVLQAMGLRGALPELAKRPVKL
ncbi:FAD-dependent oxidoreductase [Pontibacter sp. JAM-7]|uniref:FAD-dependent oxidoreductase n=1 Tax=Pontibacter sp. JAM-7 TaxID=3366581 RepID=UPI003AF61D59